MSRRGRILPGVCVAVALAAALAACSRSEAPGEAAPLTGQDTAAASIVPPTLAPSPVATEQGCTPAPTKLTEMLGEALGEAAAGATLGDVMILPADVKPSAPGDWDLVAARVTTADGTTVTPVWVAQTFLVESGWSDVIEAQVRLYAITDAAAKLSALPWADPDEADRSFLAADPDVLAAAACLE